MKNKIFIALALVFSSTTAADDNNPAFHYPVVDGHIDVPYKLFSSWADVTGAVEDRDYDYPRAVAGGLNIPFMSIYTPAKSEAEGTSKQQAHLLIDSMEALVARAPDKYRIVTTPYEALAAMQAGQIGLALGMENGSPIAGDLANVEAFRERGISYITLAHSLANHISDSSYDKERPNGGLSDFGREVVREMNRTGIMVDISHVSDDAFWQVLETTEVPVIASHSSARHFTPGFERNMSDEMIVGLAENGGVIMINFGSGFVTAEAQKYSEVFWAESAAFIEEHGFTEDSPEVKQFIEAYRKEQPFPFATFDETMAHFWHVIDLVGIDHVGIGSDYDGVGDSLPEGLKDVTTYPAIAEAFQQRGFKEEDIAKVLGGNALRVWSEVVQFAAGQGAQ